MNISPIGMDFLMLLSWLLVPVPGNVAEGNDLKNVKRQNVDASRTTYQD
jgi:hypothetical protein